MTARTSELLAKALDEVGLTTMAKLARQDIFHDFLSPHATPVLELATMLQGAVAGCPDKARAERIRQLGRRVVNGEFDADSEESEDWAKSEEGQATFGELLKPK